MAIDNPNLAKMAKEIGELVDQMPQSKGIDWRAGFRRIAWVLSILLWGAFAAFGIGEGFTVNLVMIGGLYGLAPWLIYWLGIFLLAGFRRKP